MKENIQSPTQYVLFILKSWEEFKLRARGTSWQQQQRLWRLRACIQLTNSRDTLE